MIISHELSYVYLCPPKTGTLSVRRWLIAYYKGETQKGPYHSRFVPDGLNDYCLFFTVRNPYERLFSLWHHNTTHPRKKSKGYKSRKEKGQTFLEMCIEVDLTFLSPLCYIPLIRPYIFLKIEDIAEEVKKLPFYREGTGFPGMSRKNVDKPKSFFDVFSVNSIEAQTVRKRYRKEFDLFGYDDGSVGF